MKILVIMLYWYPYDGPLMPIYGAIFRYLINKGHEVTIVTSFPHYRKGRTETWEQYRSKLYEVTDWDGVKLIRSYVFAPIFSRSVFSLLFRTLNFISFNISSVFSALFLAGKADVVFAPSSPPLTNGIISFIVSLCKRCPVVYNVQDLYPDMAVKMGLIRSRVILTILQNLERLVYQVSTKILTISEGLSEIIIAKGVPSEKIEVIENFIDSDFITPDSQDNEFSKAHGLRSAFVVMYAGNIGIPHGVEVLIAAAEILRDEKGLLFCFVARGEHKERIQTLARERGLGNTRFIDPQPQEMVPLIWASASVGAITYKRGLADYSVPSKLMAIMCAARPVVASIDATSGTSELIRKSGCGLCVPPEAANDLAQAILVLKNDAQLAATLGAKGRRYAEINLQRSVISQKYEKLFLALQKSDSGKILTN